MKTVSRMRAQRARLRASASAAAVPKIVARPVAQAATSRLFPAARWIWRERVASKSSAYHWSERPLGGNFSDRLSVNEVTSTMTTGPMRMRSAVAASAPMTSI